MVRALSAQGWQSKLNFQNPFKGGNNQLHKVILWSQHMSMLTYTQMTNKSMYMFASMLVCVPCAPVIKEARREHKIPGARVTGNCEPPCGCLESNLGRGLFTAEPSLQLSIRLSDVNHYHFKHFHFPMSNRTRILFQTGHQLPSATPPCSGLSLNGASFCWFLLFAINIT